MKIFRILFAMGLFVIVSSCGGTKTNTTETQSTIDNQVNNRGRSNMETTTASSTSRNANATVSSRVSRTSTGSTNTTTNNNRTTTVTANQKEVIAQRAKMEKMYADLDMNKEQINRFENEWKSATGSWSNQAMNDYERAETQDKIMKDILNDEQFKKYQQWAIDNAGSENKN